jgi:threonylcarbamoyladenosine tRNA methylthiotransferase MtaB
VAFETLGCRLNRAETDAMQADVEAAGHDVVRGVEVADALVLNTCTITGRADADVRARVRGAVRRHPGVHVVVTGCAANADAEAMASLPGVRLVLGNADKPSLARRLEGLSSERPAIAVSAFGRRADAELVQLRPAMPRDRVRALLPVQNGCNYRCSFCIVPHVRGPSRSRPLAEVAAALRGLVDAGVPEVVLTGAHLGTWGVDLRPRRRLHELVAALVPELGAARLRLSSIDPHEVDDALVAAMREHPDRICRHLHLPVQSCDPRVLRRMRRGHTAEDFTRLVAALAVAVPGIGIGTDVIVGFPGEDDAAFERTRATLEALPLSYHHVFTYSPRASTPAATMPDQVPAPIKAARNRALRELSAEQGRRFAEAFVGQPVDAVVVRGRDGAARVLTDNYLRLPLRGPAPPPGTRLRVVVDLDGPDVIAR